MNNRVKVNYRADKKTIEILRTMQDFFQSGTASGNIKGFFDPRQTISCATKLIQ